MEEKVSPSIKLRISVKRSEHECNNRKGYGDSANGGKFQNGQLISILLKQNEAQIYERDNSAKHIGEYRIELEVLYAGGLQCAFFGLSGEHENNAYYREDDNNDIQYYFGYGILLTHSRIIACKKAVPYFYETALLFDSAMKVKLIPKLFRTSERSEARRT